MLFISSQWGINDGINVVKWFVICCSQVLSYLLKSLLSIWNKLMINWIYLLCLFVRSSRNQWRYSEDIRYWIHLWYISCAPPTADMFATGSTVEQKLRTENSSTALLMWGISVDFAWYKLLLLGGKRRTYH